MQLNLLGVCVCVFFAFILDITFVGRTSRGHTGFLIHLPSAVRALIFLARRVQPSFLSLVNREVEFCVCVFSSHSFWTSSSLDVPAGVTQEEGYTGFFIHLPSSAVRSLIFLARRIQPFLSLVGREVEFCVLTI